MKYLLETTEIYRVDTEDEVQKIIENEKKHSSVSKVSYTHKEKTVKGEVEEEWYKLKITKFWTSEKMPDSSIKVVYKVDGDFENDEN